MALTPGTREAEIMDFLHRKVFDSILHDPRASKALKDGVRLTISRMERLPAESMIKYYWSAISGTPRSTDFADRMRREGFTRFEDRGVIDEFQARFPLV